MEHNTDPQRVYVLDLFAGYGSMRAAAKELGLSYVGVDERDLMHNTD
jgi:molybdenum-dependent DNA-binding transcriptional regulator ModE